MTKFSNILIVIGLVATSVLCVDVCTDSPDCKQGYTYKLFSKLNFNMESLEAN